MNFGRIKKFLKNQSTGAILIEFAFAIPVLVSILYFIMDGPGLRLYQLKLKNTAYFAINLLQNLSEHRESKWVTSDDFKRVTAAAFGNIYRASTMLKNQKSRYPMGHYGHIYFWCIFGNEDGTASVQWVWASGPPGTAIVGSEGFSSKVYTEEIPSTENNSIIKFGRSVTPTYIYKDLVIKPGETKVIVEVSIIVHSNVINSSGSSSDDSTENGETGSENTGGGSTESGNSGGGESIEKANAAKVLAASKSVRASGAGRLGFYLLPLKPMGGTLNSYLNYIAIFTPKPGLFNFEKAPDGTATPVG